MIKPLVLAALTATTFFSATSIKAADVEQLERNKKTIAEFYNKALNDKDVDAAIAMMGPTYVQHNPHIPDGKVGFRAFFEAFKKKYPQSHSEIIREFADGDYVVLHNHFIREPGSRGEAAVDIFRLKDGKPVEHWDVLQPIPEKLAHTNTMF